MILRILVVASLLVASVSVGAQPREEGNSWAATERIFLLREGPKQIGTGFRICKPNLILTAAHVVGELRPEEVGVHVRALSRETILIPTDIKKHPQADVAALFIKEADTAGLGCFNLAVPASAYSGFPHYLLATEILSFGFPAIEPARQRLMKGHIVSGFLGEGEDYGGYRYLAYELSFPSFSGMSGSPVFLHRNRESVIAVVTANLPYQDKRISARADWAISVALPPLAEWLESLAVASDVP